MVKAKIHRQIPEGFRMKAVTVRRQPSGKYYVSILFEYCVDENQVRDRERRERKVIGIDYAMHGLAVFSDGSKCEYPDYYRRAEKRLSREQRKLSRCKRSLSQRQTSYGGRTFGYVGGRKTLKQKFPLFSLRIPHRGKNKGKYISFHYLRGRKP